MNDFIEAQRIALILQNYIARFGDLISSSSSHLSEPELKAAASALKYEIRDENKRLGSSKYEPQSPIEQAFLIPAVRQANGEFSKYPITSPKSSKWSLGLGASRGEMVYRLEMLLQKYPEAASERAR